MSRIFSVLAMVAILMLCATIGLGLRGWGYNQVYVQVVAQEQLLASQINASASSSRNSSIDALYPRLGDYRQRISLHILCAILTSLVTIFVHSISVTYFIGTSRWCKEVSETYGLGAEWSQGSARLKRRNFPCALTGMLLIVFIVGLGAAADPGTGAPHTMQWVLPHFFAAVASCALTIMLFAAQAWFIHRNTKLVEAIMAQVREIRMARGLAVTG